MADAFFFELPKEQPAKCLSYGFRQGENRIKKPYFYRTVEIKQPHALTGPLERLCYRKWLMFFSLKLQRDNWKKAVFSPHCGDEITTYNRALEKAGKGAASFGEKSVSLRKNFFSPVVLPKLIYTALREVYAGKTARFASRGS